MSELLRTFPFSKEFPKNVAVFIFSVVNILKNYLHKPDMRSQYLVKDLINL